MTIEHPILPGFPGGDPIPQLFVHIDQLYPAAQGLVYNGGERFHMRVPSVYWQPTMKLDQTIHKALVDAGAYIVYFDPSHHEPWSVSFYTKKPIIDFLIDMADAFQSQYGGSDPVPELRITLWLNTILLVRDLDLGALTYGK